MKYMLACLFCFCVAIFFIGIHADTPMWRILLVMGGGIFLVGFILLDIKAQKGMSPLERTIHNI